MFKTNEKYAGFTLLAFLTSLQVCLLRSERPDVPDAGMSERGDKLSKGATGGRH